MSDGPIDVKSCEECQWLKTVYGGNADSHSCQHKKIVGKRDNWIGRNTLTPSWCPFLKASK